MSNTSKRSLKNKGCDCVRKVRKSILLKQLHKKLSKKHTNRHKTTSNSRDYHSMASMALSKGKSRILKGIERKQLLQAPYGICTKSVFNTKQLKGPGKYNCKEYDKNRWTIDEIKAYLYLKNIQYTDTETKRELLSKI